jgi:hypothetical protein
MEISFWSFDPAKAAQIANAISDAYIVDQLEAKYQSTRRASAWLQDRLKSLRPEALADSQAVVDFKQKNNMVESGGKLMNEQQMSEVNSQLILARAATAEAKARLDRINQVMSKDIPDASVADALKSEVIIKLRQQYLELAARESIWSKNYGSDHVAAISLRSQMLQLRRNIADEMQKIAESYKTWAPGNLAGTTRRSFYKSSFPLPELKFASSTQERRSCTSKATRSMADGLGPAPRIFRLLGSNGKTMTFLLSTTKRQPRRSNGASMRCLRKANLLIPPSRSSFRSPSRLLTQRPGQ